MSLFEQGESKRTQGAATVLVLLFGLLIGIAGNAGAQLRLDPGSARLGNGDIIRAASSLRISGRSDDDVADDEAAPALLPPPPAIVTERLSARPAEDGVQALVSVALPGRPLAYQARAPPVA